MEIQDILGHLAELNAETQEQLFQLNRAKAQVEAIGVFVGSLGNIEIQLKRIADAVGSLDETGITCWTREQK